MTSSTYDFSALRRIVFALAITVAVSACSKSESLRSEESTNKTEKKKTDQPEAPKGEKAAAKTMMTQEQLLEKAKAHLKDKAGIDAAIADTADVNYDLLLDADGTALGVEPSAVVPFVFFMTQASGGRAKGSPAVFYELGADAATGAFYYKDKAGFAAFVKIHGLYAKPDKVSARDLLIAWHILEHGHTPKVSTANAKHGKELQLQVGPPVVSKQGDAVQLVGWTQDTRGWNLAKHTVRIEKDGSVSSTTLTGQELEDSVK